MTVNFKVNNKEIEINNLDNWTLLKILREHLNLKGAKCGCKTGDCGTCSVIIDGELVRSCLVLGKNLGGKSIKTIEFYEDEKIRELQEAFTRNGAVQCGFCTPGMIMAAYSILEKNPKPTIKEIREGLKYNLCRCTGYEKITDAIYDASGQVNMKKHIIASAFNTNVGKSKPVMGALEKAQGKMEYTDDLVFNNLYHGKILFAPAAHGYIKSMNIEKARSIEGVLDIVTCMDDENWSKDFNCHVTSPFEELIRNEKMFNRHFRYDGDKIAAVVAVTEDIAQQAVKAIEFEYEEYPSVISVEAAMNKDSYSIHEGGNVPAKDIGYEVGNVEAAFNDSEIIFERDYHTQKQSHGMMEPHIAIANYDGDILTLYAPTQNVFGFRSLMTEIFDLPYNKVRVIKTNTGGAFGAKSEVIVEHIASLLAIRVKGTVKVNLSRKEEFLCGKTRTAIDFKVKFGVKEGKFNSMDIYAILDRGAYFGSSFDLAYAWMDKVYKLYECENIKTNTDLVYTNTQNAGAVRGYGAPQVNFARETAINEFCRQQGLDKVEFRLNNLFDNGSKDIATKETTTSAFVKDCLKRAYEIANEKRNKWEDDDYYYGLGIAVGVHGNGIGLPVVDFASSSIKYNADGSVLVNTTVHDLGQGSTIMVKKIVADVLGIDEELVTVLNPDTNTNYYSNGAYATRETWVNGGSVKAAAEELIRVIIHETAEIHEKNISDLVYIDGKIATKAGDLVATAAEVVLHRMHKPPFKEIEATVHFTNPQVPGSYMANIAISKVNKKTGEVKVDKMIAVHDVGIAINPMMLEGQIEGGIHMGLGLAISEEMTYNNKTGKLDTVNFKKYKMFRASDMPEICIEIVGEPDAVGPFGAKGIGEAALTAVAPSVIDSINEAIGSNFNKLPVLQKDIKEFLGI
ncbi:MAG: molybdopterin-dependent oxidoreductase [Firmicutes bacterium]|nr:molybdopterin-dependent oxidoreductase [Bacillota bacterium]